MRKLLTTVLTVFFLSSCSKAYKVSFEIAPITSPVSPIKPTATPEPALCALDIGSTGGAIVANVMAMEHITGLGFIMYSPVDVHERFYHEDRAIRPAVKNSRHFIRVEEVFNDEGLHIGWAYDSNRKLVSFTPIPGDWLIAEVIFYQNGTPQGVKSVIYLDEDNEYDSVEFNGIEIGFEESDIEITPDVFVRDPGGEPTENYGEYLIEVSEIWVRCK